MRNRAIIRRPFLESFRSIYKITKQNKLRVLLDIFNALFKEHAVSESGKGVFLVLIFKVDFRTF